MDLALETAELPTYFTFIEADKETGRSKVCELAKWAGGINEVSEGHIYGPLKADDLLSHGDRKGFTLTPVLNKTNHCPYPGGVRNDDNLVTCSGWENAHIDLVLALTAEYSMRQETRLHHVGFKFASDADRRLQMSKNFGTAEHIRLPANGHIRHYQSRSDPRTSNKNFWVEYQEYPTHLVRNGIHLDFATSEPERLLEHLEKYSGLPTQFWPRQKNAPVGMIFGIEGELEFAIMARSEYSDPATWAA